jgi:hypothetical protein
MVVHDDLPDDITSGEVLSTMLDHRIEKLIITVFTLSKPKMWVYQIGE